MVEMWTIKESVSLLFPFLWGLWHVPWFFIKGYYHYEIWQMNGWYALNFFIALIPACLLGNWIYCKMKGASLPLSFFILCLISSVLLQTEQFTMCIVTVVLLVFSGIVIRRDIRFFVEKQLNEWN